MQKITDNPQTLKDLIIGYTGTLGSLAAAAMDAVTYIVPWILGISVTLYALYNQHLQGKINRAKLKNIEKGIHEED